MMVSMKMIRSKVTRFNIMIMTTCLELIETKKAKQIELLRRFASIPQVAYYGEPAMAPSLFLEAYLQSTTEEFRLSEDAPKIDAKNPAGSLFTIRLQLALAK